MQALLVRIFANSASTNVLAIDNRNRFWAFMRNILNIPFVENIKRLLDTLCCVMHFFTQTIYLQRNITRVQIAHLLLCVNLWHVTALVLISCPSQHEGLHLDLRELNTVRLVRDKRSSTGLAAVLGPGNTWAKVLKVIPPQRSVVSYTDSSAVIVSYTDSSAALQNGAHVFKNWVIYDDLWSGMRLNFLLD